MTRACDAIACRRPTAAGKFMCPTHWRMVPLPLQRTIYARYRACRKDLAFLSDVEYLQAAVDEIDDVARADGVAGTNPYARHLAIAQRRAAAAAGSAT